MQKNTCKKLRKQCYQENMVKGFQFEYTEYMSGCF